MTFFAWWVKIPKNSFFFALIYVFYTSICSDTTCQHVAESFFYYIQFLLLEKWDLSKSFSNSIVSIIWYTRVSILFVFIGETRRGRYREPLFPHVLWNIHDRIGSNIPRTNNHLEGWHTRFAAMIDKPHPSIWKFVNALKREAAQNKLVLAQMVAGASPPTPSLNE